jgi:precorrin-2 dehydrogenase/sirohydrochlorin ferrochelatase
MSYLVNLCLEGRDVLVVGAGGVAARKVGGLLAAGASVRVVAPSAGEAVERLADEGRLSLLRREYVPEDVEGAFLVIAATDDEDLNAAVSADARRNGCLVNVVDRPALCTITLPAVVRRGDLTLAVATNGRCPAMARSLREELEARYGETYGEALTVMGRLRDGMLSLGWESARIQKVLAEIYADGVVEVVASHDAGALTAFLRRRLGPAFPIEGGV